MEAAGLTLLRRERLHRRALRLEYFIVSWNFVEAVVAITAGLIAGSVALVGFGIDYSIEVLSAMALLWRLRRSGADTSEAEKAHAERRALFAVAATFFLLAAYIAVEAIGALSSGEAPERSTSGLLLALVSLAVMPLPAYWKGRTGREMGSRALQADAVETWVCSYLSLALLAGVGVYSAFGWAWADPVAALAMLPVIVWQGCEIFEEARDQPSS
jgi:divalent metal cation (Fe/Co/Zn/Cd) transporter